MTQLTTAQRVIARAAAEVGYHEGRSGGHWDNIEKYAATVPQLAWANGQPWCDVFVAAMFKAAGVLDLIPVSASCDASRTAWRNLGRWSEYPALGAQVIFGTPSNAEHTGIVEWFDAYTVRTIEGNTNGNGSAEGDGVYRKVHHRSDPWVQGYGLPEYPEGIVSADPAFAHEAPRHTAPHAPHVEAAVAQLHEAQQAAAHHGRADRAHQLGAVIAHLHGLTR